MLAATRLLRTAPCRPSLFRRGVASITAKSAFLTKSTEKDPYQYQVGFGNRFASEAIPGVLPVGQNSPQKCQYDLYAEQITATAFTAPRKDNQNAWLYRIRPAVAHQGFTELPNNPDLESNFFPLNPKVQFSPTQLAWRPFSLPDPSTPTTLLTGLKTIAGSGDPTLQEGLAIHIYTANASMANQALVNADGDLLFVPQLGRLDIQTEFGRLMVRPGEICVVQRGVRFMVGLPDGDSRGYVQEIFGSHFELPELGPLGANGLANPRDFEFPVASFEIDQSPWEIVYKLGGKLFSCKQNHTPFDVVAYHGNYVPYKYALEKFINVGSISKDHLDPSIFCVLTAKSKTPGTPLTDFLIFSPRWDVASETYRPPYYHRNAASEFMGLIYGNYGGRSDDFAPGGASYECGHVAHGVAYEEFKAASEAELAPMRISEGAIAFMMESSQMFTLTDYAMKRSGKLHVHNPALWDNLDAQFLKHVGSVNKTLKEYGLPELKE
ncbi:Homogentisate 1,2-dioxygenase [Ceratobasidium sp. AG-I]|nr:Homogentisate 1,2-dioxygenase [Ceratobasidium sp. AG-I]